jgi:hypothetical protein
MPDQATSRPQSFPHDSSACQKTFVARKQPYGYNSYTPELNNGIHIYIQAHQPRTVRVKDA